MNNKILFALQAICKDENQGKKVVQKLIYLMERKGVGMDLSYAIHFYGPYSSDLDATLHSLENNHIIKIDTSKRTHHIKLINAKFDEQISEKESEIIKGIVEIFGRKTPLELEVITTADFVIDNWPKESNITKHDVIKQVKHIKGDKFTEQQISSSIELLNSNGFNNLAI